MTAATFAAHRNAAGGLEPDCALRKPHLGPCRVEAPSWLGIRPAGTLLARCADCRRRFLPLSYGGGIRCPHCGTAEDRP